jgi:hypothetical protein
MKKTLLLTIFVSSLFAGTITAQTGVYLGYENGIKWDRFNYINSKGYTLNKPAFNAMLGGYVGYKINRYTIETGFYAYYTSIHMIDYNRSTGEASASAGSYHSSSMDSYIIPLRFGAEFNMAKNRIFIKPEMGLTGIIAKTYSSMQPCGFWGENIRIDTSFIPTTGDSSIGYFYRPSKFNLGYEISLSAGVRIISKIDIYLKGSVCNSFKPLFYEAITYYSDLGNATATNTFHGNSVTLEIGLRYYFKKRK